MAEKKVHVLLRSRPDMHYLSTLCLEDLSQQTLDLPFLNPNLPITASSCGGLLYLDDGCGYVYLCNLTTKQFQSIPIEPPLAVSGAGSLFYDSKSGDYKIVWAHHRGGGLYSLRNDCWKVISAPATPIGKPIVGMNDNVSLTGSSSSCFWLAFDDVSSLLLCYDFTSELFSSFPLPEPLYKRWLNVRYLLVKLNDDLLGVVCYWRKYGKSLADRGYFYKVYAWKEMEMEWDILFEATLCDGAGVPIGLVDGSFLFLEGMTAVGLPDPSRLLVYNWTTGERRELAMFDHCARSALSYVDTAIVLPRGIPVVSGSIVNHSSPDAAVEAFVFEGTVPLEVDLENLEDDEDDEESRLIDFIDTSVEEELQEQMALAGLDHDGESNLQDEELMDWIIEGEKRKQLLDELQLQLDEAFLNIQLHEKALYLFEDDPLTAVLLRRHLFGTAAMPFVHTLLVRLDAHYKLKNGFPLEGSAKRILMDLLGTLSVKALQVIETLDGQLLGSFISAARELTEETGLIFKKLDEKLESDLLHSYGKDLMSQVSTESDPVAILGKVVSLLYVQIYGKALRAPDRAISVAVARLKDKIDDAAFNTLSYYHKAVVILASLMSSTRGNEDVILSLKELLKSRMLVLKSFVLTHSTRKARSQDLSNQEAWPADKIHVKALRAPLDEAISVAVARLEDKLDVVAFEILSNHHKVVVTILSLPSSASGNQAFFAKFQLDTLFYVFYSMPKDEAQLYAANEIGLIFKKLDEKLESALLRSYEKDLMSRVSAESDPVALLAKVVSLLYVRIHGKALRAPDGVIPVAVARLKDKLDDVAFKTLSDYHKAVVSLMSSASGNEDRILDQKELLKSSMPALKSLVVEPEKLIQKI